MSFRKLSLSIGAGLLGLASAAALIAPAPRSAVSPDAAGQMTRASAFFDSIVTTTRAARDPSRVSAADAIALGYLERLRLGLGSPFRLVDQTLHDPRLDDSTRTRLAWALLERTMRGEAYVVDPRVLDGMGPSRDGASARGAAHVALIERTIASAPDAREGELAVRLAYQLASGERTLREGAVPVANEVAALARDRRLAQRDVQTLFVRARADGIPAFDELQAMRAGGAFAVEQPSSTPLAPGVAARSVADARNLLDSLRSLADSPIQDAPAAPAELLGPGAARRLAALGAALPPQSPVAVAMRTYRTALLDAGLPADVAARRERLAAGATNEETLAALYAWVRASGDTGTAPALALTDAGTALRAYAQEAVWFPGDGGPTVAELRREFGVASVGFDRDVPAAWRPYYLRLVQTSLGDLQQVLTDFSADGLRIQYGVGGLPDSALAMHNPATRTIRLSIRSSAGTLAHELAHDLDAQAARRLYAIGGGYSTDRAAQGGEGPLTWSVRGLAAARLVNPLRGEPAPNESGRPTELFARDMDWFVAVSLASLGRSDGYLSAVQDAALTGYAGASPDLTPRAARALMTAAQEMTYVPEPLKDRFLDAWTDPAASDPYLLVQRVLELHPARLGGGPGWSGRASWIPTLATAPLVCVDVPNDADEALRTRAALLDLALDARALGIARMRAGWYPETRRPAWARAVLDEAPWSPAEGQRVVRRIRAGLAAQLETAADTGPFERTFPTFRAATSDCSD